MKVQELLKRGMSAAIVVSMTAGLLVGCQSTSPESAKDTKDKSEIVVRVGARDWAEQYVLMELMAYALEQNGYQAERVPDIGGTPLLHDAMVNEEIDLAANYSGSFYSSVLGHDIIYDKKEQYDVSKKEMDEQFGITLLDESEIDNSYGLFMLKTRADELGIKTMADLAKQTENLVFANHGGWFEGNVDRLKECYGGSFEWKEIKLFDGGLRYASVLNGEADVSTAYTTDGELSDDKIYLLEETAEGVYEPYFVIPFARTQFLEENPDVADIINELFVKLTEEEMVKLNYEASVELDDYDVIAQRWYDANFK